MLNFPYDAVLDLARAARYSRLWGPTLRGKARPNSADSSPHMGSAQRSNSRLGPSAPSLRKQVVLSPLSPDALESARTLLLPHSDKIRREMPERPRL